MTTSPLEVIGAYLEVLLFGPILAFAVPASRGRFRAQGDRACQEG